MHVWARWLADLPATLQRLIARTHRVALPRGATPAVRVARLRQALCTAQRVQALYYTLPPACHAALQRLRNTPHGLDADALTAQLGPLRPLVALRVDPQPRSLAERLVLAGLLFPRPSAPYHPVRYLLPPEVRRWLPTPLAVAPETPSADVATAAPLPPAAVAAAVVLLAAAERPLAHYGTASLRATTLRALAARLHPHAPATDMALLMWLVPLLRDLRVLAPDDDATLRATPAVAAFLRHPPNKRVHLLQASWLRAPWPDRWIELPVRARRSLDWPALRRRLLAWVAELPVGTTLDPATSYAACAAAFGPLTRGIGHTARATPRTPWQADRSALVWRRALEGPLTWLGLVVWDAATPSGAHCCTTTPLARAPLEPPDRAVPAASEAARNAWIYGEPGSLTIPTASLDAAVLDLLPFAQWAGVSAEGSIYRLDARTLARATAAGHARSAVRALLAAQAGPLPAAWQTLLAEPTPAVRIIHAAIALADDAEVLQRAAQRRSVRRYVAHQLAPGVALVEPEAVAGLGRALARAGVSVSIVGAPQPPPPAALSPAECALLLTACDFFRANGPASGQALDLLSERLRAQLPVTRLPPPAPAERRQAAAEEPPDALPLDPVAALGAAIAGRRAVTMVYQAAEAATPSTRTVRPLRLELAGAHWYVHAFCLAKQHELTFRLDRILALRVLGRQPRSSAPPRAKRAGKTSRGPRRGVLAAPTRPPGETGGVWLEE